MEEALLIDEGLIPGLTNTECVTLALFATCLFLFAIFFQVGLKVGD